MTKSKTIYTVPDTKDKIQQQIIDRQYTQVETLKKKNKELKENLETLGNHCYELDRENKQLQKEIRKSKVIDWMMLIIALMTTAEFILQQYIIFNR